MKCSRQFKTICILLILLVYIFVYRLFIMTHFLKYTEFINASFLMIILFFTIFLFPYQKDKSTPLKKKVNLITAILIILFFSITYLVGMFVGFLKNSYSLNAYSILNNIFSPIIIIGCTEIFRYVVINQNRNSKKMLFLITIVLTLLEIFITIRGLSNMSLEDLFKLTTTIVLPIIAKNCVLSYLTLKVGYRPALIYRLVMDLYLFVMPVVPNIGDYMNSMIGICLPFIIYIYSARTINEYYNGVEYEFKSSAFQMADIPMLLFIAFVICLVSGYFTYYVIGIGSESMEPKIYKGDAVLVKKVKSKEELKVGEIIVYKNMGEDIVHRLVEVEKKGNKTFYRTKGDNNNTRDNLDIEYKDIKGIVKLKIPYIAKPSIYLKEELSRRNKGA
jgi:signal peptidase I